MIWVGLGQGLAALGGIAGVGLLSRVLDPASYGELALAMTVAALAQNILFSPINNATSRFYSSAAEDHELTSFYSAVKALVLKATVILSTIAGAFLLALAAARQTRWIGLLVGSFFFSLFMNYHQTLSAAQTAARHRIVVAWHDGLSVIARFMLGYVSCRAFVPNSGFAMGGYAVAASLVLCSQWFFSRITGDHAGTESPDQARSDKWQARLGHYGWPFAIMGLCYSVQMASEKWSLSLFCSAADVGNYAVLFQLGYWPMCIGATVLIQLITPLLFSRAGNGSDSKRLEEARKMNHILVLGIAGITLLCTALTAAFHEQIFSVLVSGQYRSSSLLPWMILSGGIFATGQALSLSLYSDIRSSELMRPRILTSVLAVGASACGAKTLGLPGVVFSSLLCSSVFSTWVLCLVKSRPGAE